jgi:ketosteroid isomerase-like protein
MASAEVDLAALEDAFMRAVQGRDMDFLERSLGEEFTLTTGRPGAEVRSRAEWLEITRGSYVIESFEFEELDARVYGEAALVRSRYSQRGRMGEADRSTTYLMTDVWVQRDRRWQLVTRHITDLSAV